MGPLGELGALFNPGMRHEIEERQSKANRREEEGNARDGDLRIDLASGVAVIGIPGRAADETPDEDHPAASGPPSDAVKAVPTGAPTAGSAQRVASGRQHTDDQGSKRSGATGRTSRTDDARAAADTPRPAPRPASKASRAAR